MNVDKALANFGKFFENLLGSGDTGKRRVEHRNFLQLRFTHQNVGISLYRLLWTLIGTNNVR